MPVAQASASLQACIVDCLECYSLCRPHAASDPVFEDCAEICRTAADFMLRGSPFYPGVCALCAQICDLCAEKCEALDDMADCARACRGCARACRGLML